MAFIKRLARFVLASAIAVAQVTSWAAPTFEPGSCQQDVPDTCEDNTPCKRLNGMTACLAGTPNPPPSAIMLTASCWQYHAAFTCRDSASVNTCGPMRERGCAQVNTQCLTYSDTGRCLSATQTMQCPERPPSTSTQVVCNTALCQADGTGCFNTSRPADKDFGVATAMLEAQREAGVYGVAGSIIELFKGFMDECSVKTLGGSTIKSCCTSAGGGGAYRNYEVMGVTAQAAMAVGSEELKAGSKYLYDALFQLNDSGIVQDGIAAAAGGLSDSATSAVAGGAGTTFGAYGFTFSYSASGGFAFVGFDPWSFALAVIIAIITEWLQCETKEQVMQMKRGQNLCVYIDSYCATKTAGVCTEKKERHCCFNSILAKLINRQGRAQLGMDMRECGGFSEAQISQLDFSRIDLTEFIETIDPVNVRGEPVSSPRQAPASNVNYYER